MVSSATKITIAAIWYDCAASLYCTCLFLREIWLWHVLSRLNSSFYGDTLQNAKQLFLSRLLQMTKYFVMRECEHIGDTSNCSQEEISIFKFHERFLEISIRDLTLIHFIDNSNHLKDLMICILWTWQCPSLMLRQ
jgi:hypothetical protein